MFSESVKEVVINPLHCRIPISNIPIGIWVNLSIDVVLLVSSLFKSQTFRSIEQISITADSKIKRIFSMRNSLPEYNQNLEGEFQIEYGEFLPKNLSLPSSVSYVNYNVNIDKFKPQGELSDELKGLTPQRVDKVSKSIHISSNSPNRIINYKQPKIAKHIKNETIKNKVTKQLDNKNNNLLNTLNYKNMDRWDSDNLVDSIEEVFEIDERKKEPSFEEEKFYYEIPIKDSKKRTKKDTETDFKLTTEFVSEEPEAGRSTKKKIIEEILKDSIVLNTHRPFTPPFTKLIVKEKESNELRISKIITNENIQDDNLRINDIDSHSHLIYDHVLGCYYDPKTNMYYELKN